MDKLKELLIRSFDEELSAEEKQKLNKALLRSEALRMEKKEMEDTRNMIAGYSPSFSSDFSTNVLERIEEADNGLYFLFKRFALGAVAAIIMLLISVYYTDGSISGDSLLGLSDLTTDNILLALSTF